MPSTRPHASPLTITTPLRIGRLVAFLTLLVLGMLACSEGARANGSAEPLQPGDVVLLDFNARWCGPCRAMAPVVQGIEQAGWPVRHIDVDQEHDLVRRFSVTGVPCYVLLVRGHEVGRIAGATTQQELEGLLTKGHRNGGVSPLPQTAAVPQQQSVAGIPLPTTAAAEALAVATPPVARGAGPAVMSAPPAAALGDVVASATVLPANVVSGAAPVGLESPASPADQTAIQARILAASARLRVQDPEGSSRGTGTVIDCRQGEALILTCAHIFRDSQGEGRIAVDLFGSDDARDLAGQLVAWDLDRDVALVSVFTDAQIVPARVGGPERDVLVGEHVASVGCDGGADPTVHFSHITAVDKYLGPPNLQVAGQPVPGRSGGGLFSLDGSLIGVCNAADPADKEGLYAALQTVHAHLDEAGLSFVYRATYPSAGAMPLVDHAPAMPESMPSVAFDRRDRTAAVPTASTAEAPARGAAAANLSPGEIALLEQVRQHRGNAEVICIVRPHGAESTSQVFVLSGAGEDFVDHLSSAHRGQSGSQPLPAAPSQGVPPAPPVTSFQQPLPR